MTAHLCISVTFLDPLFHGKGDDEAEWPPSPMRLLQALLAGARTGRRGSEWSPAKAEAFRWLGRLDPPLILAPSSRKASPYRLSVPNNDSDVPGSYWARGEEPPENKQSANLRATKNAWPHLLLDGDTVYYLWPIGEGDEPSGQSHAEVFCRGARHLLAVGWGIDQVVGNGRIVTEAEAAALPGGRWRAWKGHRPGTQRWRVPKGDSLDDLERVDQSFLQRVDGKQYRPPLKLSRFDTVDYISATTLPPRPYAVFELPEGVAFRQEAAAKVAAMLRSVASRCAKEDSHEFPGGAEMYVAGHTGKQAQTPPRFSYLPLPTIGHEHADGMIRRLLIAEPVGGDGVHAHWAQERLRTATLRDQDGNERGVLLDLWRPASATMIRRYVAEARAWCSVTPVMLPGFDDGKHAKAEKIFLTALEHAQLPINAIAQLALRKAPFWSGSQHPRQYFAPAYLTHLARWRVGVVFREPIPGPLAIGAGRHCVLGVFAASER